MTTANKTPEFNYGQVCELSQPDASRRVIVLGNCVENDQIWVVDPKTGDSFNADTSKMSYIEDIHLKNVADCCAVWARSGNAAACWWLGWFYEGTNHYKSVWYYIAALRTSPADYKWALSRIYADAYAAVMCRGFEKPPLDFLDEISEFNQIEQGSRVVWGESSEAIEKAEMDCSVSGDTPISLGGVQ